MKETDVVLPGDKLAVSEEFLPGRHAIDEGGFVKALVVGKARRDLRNMEISVEPASKAEEVGVGDYILGHVESVQSGSAGVKLYYLNGRPTHKDFTGSLSLRGPSMGRGGRRGGPRVGPPVKLGDIVRCRVFSTVNGIIHLSVEDDRSGVVFALCGNCGRPMTRGGSKAKCDECGNVEDRKLANDFGSLSIKP